MPYLFPLVILTSCQLINGGIEWSVFQKVTDYGQNLTLFCNVSNCCHELAGWDRWTPVQRTLYIDVKTGRPNKKYDGKALKDGYTLVIQNLTKQDLNVSYSCLYGITFSERKYLLEEDVFIYISTMEPSIPPVNNASSVGEIVSILVAVAVLAGLFIICFWKRQTRNRHNTNNNEAPPPNDEVPLLESKKKIGIDEKNAYLDAIKSGTEVRQYVRIQVIGKDRSGKTSLVRRILHLEDGKYDGKSTDGIAIERKCQIRKSDGKFIVGEVETDMEERKRRIIHAFNMNQKAKEVVSDLSLPLSATQCDLETEKLQNNPPNSSQMNTDKTKKKQKRQKRGSSTDNFMGTKHAKENQTEYETIQYKETEIGTDTLVVSPKIDIETHDITNSALFSKTNVDENILIKDNTNRQENVYLKDLEQFPDLSVLTQVPIGSEISDKITDLLIDKGNEIDLNFEKEKEIMKSEGLVKCGIWDFAGQKDYYATHQTFFIPHAIYLLVTDMKDEIKAIKHDEVLDFNSIGDYIDFWFDSIHCFCEDHSARKLCPPVIMVCTGTDKFEKVENSKIEYDKTFSQTFGKQKKIDHRRGIYFISNTKFGKTDIEEIQLLRKHISEIANDMNYFAEKLPTKWIYLEHVLEVLRDFKINVYSWENMEKLAKSNLIEEEEFIPFLNYQHKIGNIIFFMEIREYIILQPIWLVKCFRCLVCDCHPGKRNFNLINPTAWATLESTGELSEILIEQLFQKEPSLKFIERQAYLLAVMEKFDIIVKPQFINTNDDTRHTSASYYMPCMITKSSSYELIKNKFIEKNSNVNITPWLVLEFKFLPLAYFNHVMFHYIRNNEVCTVNTDDGPPEAIYRGKAVFYLDSLRKFIICFSHNAISLQIWKWGGITDDTQNIYEMVLNSLCDSVESITEHLGQDISYCIKAKCSTGDYCKSVGRISFKDLTKSGKYMCEEHKCTHSNEDIEQTWLKHAEQLEDHVQNRLSDSVETVTETVTDSVIGTDTQNEQLEDHVQNSLNDSMETLRESAEDSEQQADHVQNSLNDSVETVRKSVTISEQLEDHVQNRLNESVETVTETATDSVIGTDTPNEQLEDHVQNSIHDNLESVAETAPHSIFPHVNDTLGDVATFRKPQKTPTPPINLKTVVDNGVLELKWTPPKHDLLKVEHYKIVFTIDESSKTEQIRVNANRLSCIVPNIIPQHTYRFKIACCSKTVDGHMSKECMFYSGTPRPPTNLKTYLVNGLLELMWTAPTWDIFEVEYYDVLYTSNDWMDTDHIRAEANSSSCNIPNIIPQTIYRFKIASCMKNTVGNPSKEAFFFSGNTY